MNLHKIKKRHPFSGWNYFFRVDDFRYRYIKLGGLTVDDRNEEVFAQYDIKVYNVYRVRGATVLETNRGLKLLKNFESSENRIAFEHKIKEHIFNLGYVNVDRYMRNKNDELITEDTQGGKYILKDWFTGDECNLRNLKDILLATENLAKLHNLLANVSLTNDEVKYNTYQYLPGLFDKHNRELKRVRGYIKEKRQKNEFEMCYLSCYEDFYRKGLNAVEIIKDSNYELLLSDALNSSNICHGNYTYHNILITKNGIATTNFEKICIGVQIMDFYLLIRKVMEKNDWNINYGSSMIEEYNKNKTISKEEMKILYVLLLYPEKFWKITNFYYNGKKSWIPQRNIQKLINIQEQNKVKEEFLKWVLLGL